MIKFKYNFCPFIFAAIIACCNNQNSKPAEVVSQPEVVPQKKVAAYDTTRFHKIFDLDTAGCWLYKSGRSKKKQLENEIALVKKFPSRIILEIERYGRLSICNLPAINLKMNDTVLISGTMYSMAGNEMNKGWPTILTKLITGN